MKRSLLTPLVIGFGLVAGVAATAQAQELRFKLDHFTVYEVLDAEPVPTKVTLADQFEREENEATKPVFFCVPVNKQFRDSLAKINNEKDHLTVYAIKSKDQKIEIVVSDQFGENRLRVTASQFLCLPTEKLEFREH